MSDAVKRFCCIKPCSHYQWLRFRCLTYFLSPVDVTQRIVVVQRFSGWLDHSDEMSVNVRTPKACESMDGALSTLPTDCCRLCAFRGNVAIGRIPNDNKYQSTISNKQATDRGNKALGSLDM
ncbi:hypothetical protein AVEN_203101-1 [Araneus ventricosus]|uniref:Uncharacterized protein n=1 Tax=Araneus ventricosus TaxID=182803 RepID=A0A4Y2DPQ2_ARAVE|nr:hypothetical protein AVEN_203101-1 [Araneus ventricosus]